MKHLRFCAGWARKSGGSSIGKRSSRKRVRADTRSNGRYHGWGNRRLTSQVSFACMLDITEWPIGFDDNISDSVQYVVLRDPNLMLVVLICIFVVGNVFYLLTVSKNWETTLSLDNWFMRHFAHWQASQIFQEPILTVKHDCYIFWAISSFLCIRTAGNTENDFPLQISCWL